MECAEDYMRELLDRQSKGFDSATYGHQILPIEAIIAGLTSQPCRCPKHRHMAWQLASITSATVPPPCGRNPIWGEDLPLSLSEAAAHSGMRLGSFRQRIYSREIASVMVGKQRKVQPSAVRAYFEQCKRPAL